VKATQDRQATRRKKRERRRYSKV